MAAPGSLGTNAVPSYPKNMAAVTPHASATFAPSVVWTTDGGDITVITAGGDTVLVEGVPPGGEIKCEVVAVRVTNTTATKIYRSW